ncbi:tRNA1(Val) (adenine(37)-N6)-methyltransferase [Shimwellia pseudoproteus]|uniref:tRNA(1)(Val) (adenine(37)-N(6))-methyltransferase TrmN n=1 Tax=Shimwellia pseudoproteus TaxID=570012 RepID=UPI0018EC6845|nr:tRNA1(Val) (adenine(37)-N6)-methyltransferase [Shimwellia pseudoproteus]MBJ3816574.1 tRNA1(Val) (adenine(37)-N6)-methyltransferase [Shimwellia pseudoproteus]
MSSQKNVLPRNGFTFKQFFVAHDRCAMKVGTDGILLGAWAPVAGLRRVLDIGTGSGLLALMLAQRARPGVHIDAVELDADAAGQARENIAASPWKTAIQVHQDDIQHWCQQQPPHYDLIISNPPYYEPGVACSTEARDMARYTGALDYATLLNCAAQSITEDGFFCVVLPQQQGEQFIALAVEQGWFLRLRTDVCEMDARPSHRVLLGLSPRAGECFQDRLVIRGPDQQYSSEFCGLTGAFYLFM